MTPAEQLTSLPDPVAERVWEAVRVVSEMDAGEKHTTVAMFHELTQHLGRSTDPDLNLPLLFVCEVGRIVGAVHDAATPGMDPEKEASHG